MPQNLIDIRRQRWLPYIRKLADMYGLKDWIFELDNERPNDANANASIYCTPGRKHGYIRLSQFFLDDNPQDQRLTIVHELSHAHNTMDFSFAQGHLPEEMKAIHTTLMEYGIDGLSTAIAPFFPLPGKKERG